MGISRRDFLKGATALTAALAVKPSQLFAAGSTAPNVPVIWLQGQCCTGCSVSFMNSVNITTADDLLLNYFELEYHPTLMASSGDLAVSNLDTVYNESNSRGYVLIIEGTIPTGANGNYCHVYTDPSGNHVTMYDAVDKLARDAASIIAVGTCASFGGMSAAGPNPTGALSVEGALSNMGLRNKDVINIPGCPIHPDWLVWTVAQLLSGSPVPTDRQNRPQEFFSSKIHSNCPNRGGAKAKKVGDHGCYMSLGCKGPKAQSDCPNRKWNSGDKINGVAQPGVNWCIESRVPCHGCTAPDFPGSAPFFEL